MASMPVLNLDRLIDRPVVIIADQEYRLYTVDLLAPIDNYRVRQLLKRVDALSAKDELTPTELDELAGPVVMKGKTPQKDAAGNELRRGGLLDRATRIVLEAPDSIHQKLTDNQRVEVIQTFQVPSLILKYAAPATAEPTAVSLIGSGSAPEPLASTPEKAAPSTS